MTVSQFRGAQSRSAHLGILPKPAGGLGPPLVRFRNEPEWSSATQSVGRPACDRSAAVLWKYAGGSAERPRCTWRVISSAKT